MAEELQEKELLKELESMQEDPWLPAESKLVSACLILGILFLIIFVVINRFILSH